MKFAASIIALAFLTVGLATPTDLAPADVAHVDPSSPATVPVCYWEGTSPFCKGKCKPGWNEVQRNKCGDGKCCITGDKALCCQGALQADPTNPTEPAVADQAGSSSVPVCYWEGTSPFCKGKCKSGWNEVQRNKCGDGKCCITGDKALCCQGS